MFTCKNCGGELRFDISSQQMKCDHCGSLFDPKGLTQNVRPAKEVTDAADTPAGINHSNFGYYDVMIYKCPQCGGEIISTEEAASDYCTYCGSFVQLEGRPGRGVSPQYIIPFAKTKEECLEAYRKSAKRAVFAPDSMRTPAFLERFRGMYMPYWLYDVEIGNKAKVTSTGSEKTRGSYAVRETKEIPVAAQKPYENIAFDASGAFNDRISRQLTPFVTGSMEEFSPAYMAGFYAVNADVDADVYANEAEVVAAKVASEAAAESIHRRERAAHKIRRTKLDDVSDVKIRANMDTKVIKKKPALLPIWFLTWKQNKRVGYSVVNGVTGECVSMFPISILKFLTFALLLALPLYLGADTLLTMTPKMALFSAAVMSLIMLYIYRAQITRINEHEHHDDDPGYFTGPQREERRQRLFAAKRQMEKRKREVEKETKSLKGALLVLFWLALELWEIPVLLIINLGDRLFSGYSDKSGFRIVGYIVLCILVLIAVVRMFRTNHDFSNKFMLAAGILPAAGILGAVFIDLKNPVQDIIYYGAVMANLLIILIIELILIGHYNSFVTEDIPNFFKEGSNPSIEKAPDKRKMEQTGDGRNKLLYSLTVLAAAVLLAAAVVKTSEVDWRAFISDTSHVIENSEEEIDGGLIDDPSEGYNLIWSADNGNRAIVADAADLLSDGEARSLLEDMKQILKFGNAAFISEYPDTSDTGLAAARAYDKMFKEKDGTEFYFDMRNRKIFIYSMGSVLKVITTGYANTITDNVYRHASAGNFYRCADEAFKQIYTVLDGGRIAQPMKHLSNAFLAVIMGLLIGYGIVIRTVTGRRKPGIEMIAGAGGLGAAIHVAQHGRSRISTTKRYVGSSGSSGGSHGGWSGGGGGGFSGGSSGGGGGFSGGGGGHSF